MKRLALVAVLLVWSSICPAGYFDGNELLDSFEACKKDNTYECGRALGYIYGFFDTQEGFEIIFGSRLFCPPQNLYARQPYDLAFKVLRENPAQRNSPATALLLRAFQEAWPCPEK